MTSGTAPSLAQSRSVARTESRTAAPTSTGDGRMRAGPRREAEDATDPLGHAPGGFLGMDEIPRGLVIPDAVPDCGQASEDHGEEARHVSERRGARVRSHDRWRFRVTRRLARGPSRLGVEARVPERDGCRPAEDGRQDGAAGPRASEREHGDQPLVDRERQHGSGRRAQASSELRVRRGVRHRDDGLARLGDGRDRRRAGGHRRALRQPDASREDKSITFRPQDRRRVGAEPGPRLAGHGHRRSSSIEALEERCGHCVLSRARGPGLEALAEPRRGDDERADRVGLEGDWSPARDQERAERQAGMIRHRNDERRAEAVLLEEGVRTAETGASLHHLVGGERAADDPFARADLERESEATLRQHDWSGVPLGTDDRRAVRAGVREGAVDRQETGLSRCGAATDGQETVEAREMGASGLVEEDAG